MSYPPSDFSHIPIVPSALRTEGQPLPEAEYVPVADLAGLPMQEIAANYEPAPDRPGFWRKVGNKLKAAKKAVMDPIRIGQYDALIGMVEQAVKFAMIAFPQIKAEAAKRGIDADALLKETTAAVRLSISNPDVNPDEAFKGIIATLKQTFLPIVLNEILPAMYKAVHTRYQIDDAHTATIMFRLKRHAHEDGTVQEFPIVGLYEDDPHSDQPVLRYRAHFTTDSLGALFVMDNTAPETAPAADEVALPDTTEYTHYHENL
jgi:hypothetical protein